MVYHDIIPWFDLGAVIVILFDFSKALRVACHTILIDKLRLLGVGGRVLDWIPDFLTGRIMHVSMSVPLD